ncbi:Cna B-type domain-containing protein [Clostridium sp. AM58-1XD]|nr:Cna B-type domain-containing protein [Clostridium sp. AM58-1XD]
MPIVYTAEEAAGGVPGYTQSMKVSSETSGTEEIEVFQITNTMNTASVDIEKTWDDSDNYYHTRPETITVKLQRSVDEGDQKNWTDVVRPAGVTDGIQLGGGIWGRKLTKEKDDEEYDGNVWKWADVFTGLPTHDKNGNAYSYRAAEVNDEANGYVWSDEAVSESAAGTGKKFTQMLTNALDTAQVSGTKIWIDKSSFFHTRPDSIALTLTGSTKSRTEWIQVPAVGQPVWTKQGDTWKYEYKGLPKYLILTENGEVQKEEITWTVKETVPAGYTLIQDGYELTNTLDTLEDWTVTKTWNDENDKYHVRPSSISFSVWADGVKLNPQPAAHRDGWTYTLKGLPAVYPAGHPKEGQPVDYEVREDGTDFYTTVTATSSEATYFTNTLIQGGLSVSKQRVKGADEEFRFKVTLTRPDGFGAAMQPQIYTGGYKVFQGLGADVAAAAPSAERMTASDGIITIRADEKFLLTGLPAGFTYQVEEIGAEGYEVTADHSAGIIVKDGISEASFTNTASGKLKITNVTENPGSAVSGEGSSTAGGRVTVITESSSNPDKPDTDPYQPDKTAIFWKPEQHWMTGGSLVIRYTDYGTELEKTVTVKDYCDESGRMKPLSDPCYKELLERFPETDIAQASDGTITMALADKAENMPKQTAVEVTFIPTIKGHLLTGTETGSVNEQGVSGSIGEGGDIRYNGSRVMGTAAGAYTAEVEKLLVGGPGLSKPVTITVLKDGTFTEEIEVDIYGVPTKVTVSGKAVYTYSGSRITNVEIVMDEVPVPLDLGIGFKRKSSGSGGGGGGGGSSTTPGTKPGAGDTNSAGPGVETEQETNPADPLSPTGPVNPTDPLNPTDPVNPADPLNPDTVQPAGPAVIEPDKPGRPPVQMEKNPGGGIDITVPGDDVSEVEVKDEAIARFTADL